MSEACDYGMLLTTVPSREVAAKIAHMLIDAKLAELKRTVELRRADVNAVLRCDTNGVALGAIKSTKPNEARRGQPGAAGHRRSRRRRPLRWAR